MWNDNLLLDPFDIGLQAYCHEFSNCQNICSVKVFYFTRGQNYLF